MLDVEANGTEVPAVAQQGADGVGAFVKEAGDVVGLVLKTFFIRGPTGCQVGVADTLAVETCFVKTVGSDIDSGRGDGAADCEVGAKERIARLPGGITGPDPPGFPVFRL